MCKLGFGVVTEKKEGRDEYEEGKTGKEGSGREGEGKG